MITYLSSNLVLWEYEWNVDVFQLCVLVGIIGEIKPKYPEIMYFN